MAARVIAVEPFDMVVFGATGDVAACKLFPALYHRELLGQLPDDARIIGTSRRELSAKDFLTLVETSIAEHVRAEERDPAVLIAMPSTLAQTALDGYGPKEASSLVGISVVDGGGKYLGVVNSVQHDGQGLPIVVKIGMGGIFGFFQRIVPVTVDQVELKTDAQGGW